MILKFCTKVYAGILMSLLSLSRRVSYLSVSISIHLVAPLICLISWLALKLVMILSCFLTAVVMVILQFFPLTLQMLCSTSITPRHILINCLTVCVISLIILLLSGFLLLARRIGFLKCVLLLILACLVMCLALIAPQLLAILVLILLRRFDCES